MKKILIAIMAISLAGCIDQGRNRYHIVQYSASGAIIQEYYNAELNYSGDHIRLTDSNGREVRIYGPVKVEECK